MATLRGIVEEVVSALTGLYDFADLEAMAGKLGYDLSPVRDYLSTVASAIDDLITLVAALEDLAHDLFDLIESEGQATPAVLAKAKDAIEAIQSTVTGLAEVPRAFDAPTLASHAAAISGSNDVELFVGEFAERALGYVVVDYLDDAHPVLRSLLTALGVITVTRREANAVQFRTAFTEYRVRWSKLKDYLVSPNDALGETYNWGLSAQNVEPLLDSLGDLLQSYGVLAGSRYMPAAQVDRFGEMLPGTFPAMLPDSPSLVIDLWCEPVSGSRLRLELASLPPTDQALAGVGLSVDAVALSASRFALSESVSLALEGTGSLAAGLLIAYIPGGAPAYRFDTSTPSVGDMHAHLTVRPSLDQPLLLLGTGAGNRLEVGGFGGSAGIVARQHDGVDLFLEVELAGCRLVIQGGEGDGFISRIFPDADIDARLDLTIGWSSRQGIYLRGSGGIEIEVPVHKTIGPLEVVSVFVRIGISPGGAIPIALGLTAIVQLGPIVASVTRVGARFTISFPQGGGNLGSAQLDYGFLPPTGAGLAINAGGVSGGGYLEHTEADSSYAGVLALNFGEIGLTAVGLISTRMPDGSPGYALLIIIGVEFSPPIQLTFGFTLSGVGGLLAVNRTLNIEALRTGLKQHTTDSILFPTDPILNAPKIISDLKAVFPIQTNRFIVGPMVKIGWGNNIVQADIGIFIELPEPIRVVLLGEITALFPKPEDPIVELHIDVLGVIEFAKKTLAIDAAIYGMILDYPLNGGAAVRMKWGDNPTFGMSLGGFHPRFAPPPAFPNLDRLTLDLSSSSSFQLSCKVYHALTSNSLQFGARIDAHAEAGATLDGDMSCDALIYFSPFAFVVEMSGGMVARYRGTTLAGVRLSLMLSGPTPWRAKGKAKFEILMWDVTVSFNESWGRDRPAEIPAVNAWQLLSDQLHLPGSWGASLPGRSTMVEALKTLEAGPGVVVLHPAGTIELRQRLLPLGLTLDKVANAPITGARTFGIARIQIGDISPVQLITQELRDYFARAQYLDVSDGEKLSLPSFEKLICGAGGTTAVVTEIGTTIPCELRYESIVIDGTNAPEPSTAPANWAIAHGQLRRAAAARNGLRTIGINKFLVGRTPVVKALEPAYRVVTSAGLVPVPAADVPGNEAGMTRMEADQALASYIATDAGQSHAMVVEAIEAAPPVGVAAAAPVPAPSTPPAPPLAQYAFTPAVRRGLAAAIEADAVGERATVSVHAIPTADGEENTAVDMIVQLYGPGDILGFDARIVTRTDPLRNVGDFEPNYFPTIDLPADFPWRFSPVVAQNASPQADPTLQPWITLVVLERENEFTFNSRGADGKPPSITVGSATSLPNLAYVNLWAHVHLTGTPEDDIGTVDREEPERVLSRLMCPRRLKPGTAYHAFVVPTYKIGCVAAGLATMATGENATTPAWLPDDTNVSLPYYYDWEFGTGLRGDFEYLVRLLEPRRLEDLGVRPMDCSALGYSMPPVRSLSNGTTHNVLGLEGALRSLDTEYEEWGFARKDVATAAPAEPLQGSLSQLVNKPVTDRAPRTVVLAGPGTLEIDRIAVEIEPASMAGGQPVFSATITWRMAADWTGLVALGLTTAYGDVLDAGPSLDLERSVTFSNLAARRTYHFRITATDPNLTSFLSADLSFTVPDYPLPTVVPPIYGGWYVGRQTVSPPSATTGTTTWFEELNLDPRHRAMAGYGAHVVEQQQEPLMASLWDQLGDIDEANEVLRCGQVGREAAAALFGRLGALGSGDFLRVTAPVHGRVPFAAGSGATTVAAYFAASKIPIAAFDPALRRIRRARGPVGRRQDPNARTLHGDMLARMNQVGLQALVAAGPHPAPGAAPGLCDITMSLPVSPPSIDPTAQPPVDMGPDLGIDTVDVRGGNASLVGPTLERASRSTESSTPTVDSTRPVDATSSTRDPPTRRRFCEGQITCDLFPTVSDVDRDLARGGVSVAALKEAVCDALDTFLAAPMTSPPADVVVDLPAIEALLKVLLDPRKTVPERVLSRLRLNLRTEAHAQRLSIDPLGTLTASPDFPQPMYEPLRDISQDLILPGVETVPQNTIGLLQTNGRCVESYMCAINHSFTGEALWRGAPVGGRESYFRQFWDIEDVVADRMAVGIESEETVRESLKDVRKLIEWRQARLGNNDNRPVGSRQSDALVLCIRGDVLKKYPRTVVYAIEACGPANGRVPALLEFSARFESDDAVRPPIAPIFSGSLSPDLMFFGFPFSEDDARHETERFPKGLFFILEERVSEARFGMDEAKAAELENTPAGQLDNWDGLSWDYFGSDADTDGTWKEPFAYGSYLDDSQPVPISAALTPPWSGGPAAIARITLQKPTRLAVYADRMLPEQ